MFACERDESKLNGKTDWIQLIYAGEVPIRRYRKIRAEANPFDPKWETYFEKRISSKMVVTLRGQKKLLRFWRYQKGLCPICLQLITKETGWNLHHLIRRVDGGRNTDANLVMLHPNCHNQVHSQKLTVVKSAYENRL